MDRPIRPEKMRIVQAGRKTRPDGCRGGRKAERIFGMRKITKNLPGGKNPYKVKTKGGKGEKGGALKEGGGEKREKGEEKKERRNRREEKEKEEEEKRRIEGREVGGERKE